jgi:hypothetical protein
MVSRNERKTKREMSLKKSNLSCLKTGNWIIGKVIDSYLAICFNSSSASITVVASNFVTHLVRNGVNVINILKTISNKKIHKYNHILLPINNTLWNLFQIDI